VKLRSNTGIIVESSHANRYLRAVRPIAAKQARSTVFTESFHCAFALSVNLDQLFTLDQAKPLFQHPCLGTDGSSRVLAAAIAMTVIRLKERRIGLEPHAAAQATTADWLYHNVKYI
jgi:hypothetical protein